MVVVISTAADKKNTSAAVIVKLKLVVLAGTDTVKKWKVNHGGCDREQSSAYIVLNVPL